MSTHVHTRLRRHRHRRRIRRHLHAAQAAQRARPDRPGLRQGRRRRRHLVLEQLPGRASPTPRASSTATPSTRTCCRSGTGTRATSSSPTSSRYLEPRRRPLRPAPRHPAEHRGRPAPVFDEDSAAVDGHAPTTARACTAPLPGQRRSGCCRRPTCPTSRVATPSPARSCTPRLAGGPRHHRQAGRRHRHRLHRHPVHRRRRRRSPAT